MTAPEFVKDDGGRSKYFKGSAGDCVTRAIAIATQQDYRIVYDELQRRQQHWLATARKTKRVKAALERSSQSVRDGTAPEAYRPYLEETLGWVWTPTMKIGTTERTHVSPDELPSGRLILRTARHLVAMIDGVIHDSWDSSDSRWTDGQRLVYGYWSAPGASVTRATPEAVEEAPLAGLQRLMLEEGRKRGVQPSEDGTHEVPIPKPPRRRRLSPQKFTSVMQDDAVDLVGPLLFDALDERDIRLVRLVRPNEEQPRVVLQAIMNPDWTGSPLEES